MSKKSKANPRMLTHVLQAVADLKDINGSTARKILDQVQTAISLANIKPKPRNVVMQVRKALKHAVDAGVLKQRAGKYRLALGMDTDKNYGRKACNKKKHANKKKKKCKKPDRSGKAKGGGRMRKPCKKRYNSLATSSMYSGYRDSYSVDTLQTDSEAMLKSAKRRGRKTKKGRGGVTKSPRRRRRRSAKRGKRRQRKSRQPTPLPLPVEDKGSELDDDTNTTGSERGGTTRAGNRYQEEYNHDDFPCENYNQREMDLAPECDNPDCLCNLKQEPYDDNTYDDSAGFNMM